MEKDFWHSKWKNNETGFHLQHPNPNLVKHLDCFDLGQPSLIFVPLCGKTVDMPYLTQLGHHIVGVELSEKAIIELFKSLEIDPVIDTWTGGLVYQSERLKIYVGDFFELTPNLVGPIDFVYDRAALVALPQQTRPIYTKHLTHISGSAAQLLITMAYNQHEMDGPPFSVSEKEVRRHYECHQKITLLDCNDILEQNPRFKEAGLTALEERVYKLEPKSA